MAKKLFIPGPVDVHPEILQAMATPMIGHRMKEYAVLHREVKDRLKQLLFTDNRVFLATSSAFGVMEGAVRNLVAKRCANFCNGAFSDKWHDVTRRCGKEADAFKVEWGQPITPELVDSALSTGKYDAITFCDGQQNLYFCLNTQEPVDFCSDPANVATPLPQSQELGFANTYCAGKGGAMQANKKDYQRIEASLRAVGLLEPLVVHA